MSTEKITLRKDKGSALTYEELDSNFEEYVIFRNKFATVDSSTGIATFPQFSGDNDGKVLYWDNANAKVNVKTLSASDLAAGFGANFNSHLALKTTSDLSEGTNLYYTTTRANTDFDSRLATKSTTNLAEGSNLYYTDARVLTKINSTSVRQMQDMPTANVVTDDSKVVTYDATTDSFRYASMLTESLLPVTDHGLITDGNVITGSSGVTTTTLQALTNVNFASVSGAIDGNVLVYDATASEWKAGVVTTNGGVVNTGVTTFGALSDTPANFTGHAGKYVKVNSGETGVEFDALTTDDLSEGTSKFYTDSRFDTRLSAKSTDDLTEGSSNFYYTDTKVDGRIALQVGANLNLGSKTTDHLAEGSTNEYYTTFRANTAIDTRFPQKYIYDLKNVDTPTSNDDQNILFYDHASTRFKWGQLNDTADLPEGTNLYFTNARADARISAASIGALSDVNTSGVANGKILKYNGSAWVVADDASGASSIALTDLSVGAEGSASGDGAIAYDNSTGVFTYTPPTAAGIGALADLTGQPFTTLSDVTAVTGSDDGKVLYYDHSNSDFRWKSISSINDLADVDTTGIANSKILKYNASSSKWVIADDTGGGGGATDFTSLTDTPANFTGSANKFVKVNSGETGVEFIADPGYLQNLSALNTDSLSEGSTNQYFTNARADARADARIAAASVFDLSNVPSGIPLANTNTHSIAKMNGNKDGIEFVSVGSTIYSPDSLVPTGEVSWSAGPLSAIISWRPPTEAGMLTLLGSSLNTSNVTENTNLYYTNARADARIALASLTALADVDAVTSSDNNKVLYYDHSTTSFKWTAQSGGGGGGTPGGVDTQVQFNDGSSFGGDSTFTFNKTTDTLTVKNIVVEGSLSPTSNSGGIFTITSPTKIILQPTTLVETTGPFKLSAHTSGSLPTADAGSMIAISNNGYKPAYYDGSAWRYVHDNNTV